MPSLGQRPPVEKHRSLLSKLTFCTRRNKMGPRGNKSIVTLHWEGHTSCPESPWKPGIPVTVTSAAWSILAGQETGVRRAVGGPSSASVLVSTPGHRGRPARLLPIVLPGVQTQVPWERSSRLPALVQVAGGSGPGGLGSPPEPLPLPCVSSSAGGTKEKAKLVFPN